MSDKTYLVNEIFYSIQGEGIRAGTANIFVRFSGCNLKCRKEEAEDSPGGFDCDTEFTSGRKMTVDEILEEADIQIGKSILLEKSQPVWFILTGGEPGLQIDENFISACKARMVNLAIETNGSVSIPAGIDWITVSPKVAEHAIVQKLANEVKYVRNYGQGIPKTVVQANHYLISPGFDGSELDPRTLAWCIKLVKQNPKWRLSVQQHKAWKVR